MKRKTEGEVQRSRRKKRDASGQEKEKGIEKENRGQTGRVCMAEIRRQREGSPSGEKGRKEEKCRWKESEKVALRETERRRVDVDPGVDAGSGVY